MPMIPMLFRCYRCGAVGIVFARSTWMRHLTGLCKEEE